MKSSIEVNARSGRLPIPEEQRPPREDWPRWADTLRRYQLDGLAAWLLEAGRPLALLTLQALYMGRPFLGDGVDHLTNLLESDGEAGAFAAYLETGPQTSSAGGSGGTLQ